MYPLNPVYSSKREHYTERTSRSSGWDSKWVIFIGVGVLMDPYRHGANSDGENIDIIVSCCRTQHQES